MIDRYVQFISKVERYLLKMLTILLIALLVAQCLLQIPSVRLLISPTYQLEGVPVDEEWLQQPK